MLVNKYLKSTLHTFPIMVYLTVLTITFLCISNRRCTYFECIAISCCTCTDNTAANSTQNTLLLQSSNWILLIIFKRFFLFFLLVSYSLAINCEYYCMASPHIAVVIASRQIIYIFLTRVITAAWKTTQNYYDSKRGQSVWWSWFCAGARRSTV